MSRPVTRIEWVTGLLLLYVAAGAGWVTWRVFGDNPPDVPMGTSAAYATLFAAPPLAVGLWKWARRWYEKRSERHE